MSPEVQVCGHLVEALEADLIGPFDRASGQEVLPLPPSRWYLTGFLAPRGGGEEPEAGEDESELAADEIRQLVEEELWSGSPNRLPDHRPTGVVLSCRLSRGGAFLPCRIPGDFPSPATA